MNRRQFLKRIGAACVAAVTVPVVLTVGKSRTGWENDVGGRWPKGSIITGSHDEYIPFNTPITGLKNIADEALIIYTKDEVWMLKKDSDNGGVLTKLGNVRL